MFHKCDPQHAHVSRGEVIGLLGGTFKEEEKVLKVDRVGRNNLLNETQEDYFITTDFID